MKKAIENQSLIVAAIVKNNNYWFRQHNIAPHRIISIEFTEYVCAVAIALKKETRNQIQSGTYCALFMFGIRTKEVQVYARKYEMDFVSLLICIAYKIDS